MIDVSVLDIQPHPDQARRNPGCWAVQLRVTRKKRSVTFWRWHHTYEMRDGSRVPLNYEPAHAEILTRFWDDTFSDLHGFSFNKDDP